jgi:hypothetical protein
VAERIQSRGDNAVTGEPLVERSTLDRLALEEARRAVDGQAAALNELRTRAGMLTASASVIVSFLGAQALTRSGWSPLSLTAIVAFLATLGLTAHIAWPRSSWRFRVDPTVLLADFDGEARPDGLTVERHVAESLHRGAVANQDKLETLYISFRLALATIGLQACLWTIQLSSHAS